MIMIKKKLKNNFSLVIKCHGNQFIEPVSNSPPSRTNTIQIKKKKYSSRY